MKIIIVLFILLLVASCSSSNKFTRSRHNAYQHEIINTSKVTKNDVEYAYERAPVKIQKRIDNKELKFYKVIQPGMIFYVFIDAKYKGLISNKDVVFVTRQPIEVYMFNKKR